MRVGTVLLLAAALLAGSVAGSASAAGPIKVTISAPTKPKVNVPWAYTVKVVDGSGKPVAAKLSVVVVDPLGTPHPVEFYKKPTFVTNVAIEGVFSDKIVWPPTSVGYLLKLRATAKAGTVKASKTLALTVK